MAKLTRVTQPIFASAAAVNETSVFGTMKTSAQYTANIADSINTVAFTKGWSDAVELDYAPFMEDMNTVQRAITYQIAYSQQEGIPEWASDTTYFKGSWAKYNATDGAQIYESLVDNNTGNLVSDTTKWKLVLDTANGYVTTNTAQTITGAKTFSSMIKAVEYLTYRTTLTKGTAPATVQYINHYLAGDSQAAGDANALGLFRTVVGTDNTIQTVMHAFKNVASSTASVLLRVYYNTDSNKFGAEVRSHNAGTDTNESLSAITNSTSSTIIPTMGWVNNPETSTNVVHRSDSETITGAKTFTQGKSGWINVKTTSIAYTETPSSSVGNVYGGFTFVDKNGAKISDIYTAYYTGGGGFSGISLLNHSGANEQLSLDFDANGNFFTVAPASDKANSIVTTVAKSKSANGYYKLGNGLIIQWGTLSSATTTGTLTFPLEWPSTNYIVVGNTSQNINRGDQVVAEFFTKTTKNCKYNSSNACQWIAVGY